MSRTRSMAAAVLLAILPLAGAQAQTGSLSISTQMEAVFNLAAELYPDWFTNGDPLALYEGYTYRYFPQSGIYVGIKNDEVYVMGGPFGSAITRQGTVGEVQVFLDAEKIRINPNNPDVAGDFDLTITGTTAVNAGGFALPAVTLPPIVVEEIAGPSDTSDSGEIEEMLREYFDGLGEIRNLEVVIINDTSSRLTFDVNFNGTVVQQGITSQLEYDLRFDFVKN